uniref:Uncharacterized protein n=1 Tax=Monopterus albus TaxID=43700 RepID=A0A3Q3JCR8_MONAL
MLSETGISCSDWMSCPRRRHMVYRDSASLPKHSYWFDFWVFVLIDLALFVVMYFVIS